MPCSIHSPTEPLQTGFEPSTCLADWNPFPLSKIKTGNMISLFALLSFICGTKCSQIVEVCAQSEQHYQGLLSWGLLCQELVKSHCKKILMDLSPYLLHLEGRQITPQIKEHHNRFIGFSWSILQQAQINSQDVTDTSSPHLEARPLGVCCYSQITLRGHFCETFQTWAEWVHNLRAGRAPSILLAVTQLQGMLTGPMMDPGSVC